MVKYSMLHNINRTLRMTLDNGREVTGKLLVFDQHMNVVLGDATESRPVTSQMAKNHINGTRSLGLVMLRGEHVVSVSVVGEGDSAESAAAKEQPDLEKTKKKLPQAGAKRMRTTDSP